MALQTEIKKVRRHPGDEQQETFNSSVNPTHYANGFEHYVIGCLDPISCRSTGRDFVDFDSTSITLGSSKPTSQWLEISAERQVFVVHLQQVYATSKVPRVTKWNIDVSKNLWWTCEIPLRTRIVSIIVNTGVLLFWS